MFFHISLKKELLLYPRNFGPNIEELLKSKLVQKVEGSCSGKHGFIICVTEVTKIGQGKIREGAGVVSFPIEYNAVVFMPFKGEVLDGVVTTVNKMGFFADVGPLSVFVSKWQCSKGMEFDSQSNPVSYVQNALDEQPVRITKNSDVRLKLLNTHFDASEIRAIGTIKENYLGLIES